MKNIKTLRTEAGMSQFSFASLFGVHQTAVSQWEKGRTNPDTRTAKAIADYFHVDLDYVLDRETEEDEFLIALSAEAKALTDEQKQDVLDFIRFKKSQKK
ncbi:MAG TPA: helix-turn-helix transcriptional regulator [Oscillospiraceae bacterium]|mgnify:CR=1 FL=1|nr:helix-turn-helix transcriptional regulator [Oscillospiraceae bacterium]HPS35905.1 helix-turn-helix transcriptional regulator [Oscillospiraceae bacterium]